MQRGGGERAPALPAVAEKCRQFEDCELSPPAGLEYSGGSGGCSSCSGVPQSLAGVSYRGVDRDVQKVTYCTDVEGHWHYFCNFVDLSNGLSFAESGDHRECRSAPKLVLEDDWHFVFGGDACDKGPGTIRFLQCVIALKKKHPDRVHLLLGNRDVNKMRWTSELDDDEIGRLSPESPGAYWVKPESRVRPWDYCRMEAARAEDVSEDMVSDELIRQHNTASSSARYHLKYDMGSDGEFEFRRQEIAHMSMRRAERVSDAEVVESFRDDVRTGGIMRDYLRYSELACLLGETLFVHGQIIGNQFDCCPGDAWCIQKVPDEAVDGRSGYRTVERLEEWVGELNEWAASEVADWEAHPTWRIPPTDATLEGWSARGGAGLIAYGTPATPVPSVVYCRWLEDNCMPKAFPPELSAYLSENGVRRVIVGHTPHGSCPTVIPSGDVYVIMADTSYSRCGANAAYRGDNRGDAVSDVAVQGRCCTVKGRTDAQPEPQVIDYKVPPGGGGDLHIGAMQPASASVEHPFFVKAHLPSLEGTDNRYLLCNVDGFTNTYQEVDETWVVEEFSSTENVPTNRTRTTSLTSCGEEFGHSFRGYDGEVVQHIFRRLDRDGNGWVSRQELMAACTEDYVRQALAWTYPKSSLQEAFRNLDVDNDGRITMEEFSKAVYR